MQTIAQVLEHQNVTGGAADGANLSYGAFRV